MCGILGLLLHDPSIDAAPEICEGLSLLQHRGQDACGIVTCGPKGRFYQCKANGMVRDIFDEKSIQKLVGGMGVGHGELRFSWYAPREMNAAIVSPLPHSWQLQQRGSTTLLREFTVRYCLCACAYLHSTKYFVLILLCEERQSDQYRITPSFPRRNCAPTYQHLF